MSSCVSHLPYDLSYKRVVGLGMNQVELNENPQLTNSIVQNLCNNPILPFADHSFDGCMITVSVQYLVKPLKLFSEIGISITGIAGPTGGTHDKPVGLVFIGYSQKNYDFVKKYLFHGDRKSINYRTTKVAIDIVRRELIHE